MDVPAYVSTHCTCLQIWGESSKSRLRSEKFYHWDEDHKSHYAVESCTILQWLLSCTAEKQSLNTFAIGLSIQSDTRNRILLCEHLCKESLRLRQESVAGRATKTCRAIGRGSAKIQWGLALNSLAPATVVAYFRQETFSAQKLAAIVRSCSNVFRGQR